MPLIGPPNVENLKRKKNVRGLIKALNYIEDIKVREAAAIALGQIGDPLAVEPLMAVIENIHLETRQLCKIATRSLGQIGDSRPIKILVTSLDHYALGPHAAEALIEIGDFSRVDLVISILKGKYIKNVDPFIHVLINTGEEAVEPLINLLMDRSEIVHEDIRVAICYILGSISDPRAIDSLINTLGDETGCVRFQAAKQLAKFDDSRAIAPLIAMIPDNYPDLDEVVTKAIGEIGDPRAVEPLIFAFKDEYPIMHKFAVEAIVEIGEPALESLLTAIKDEHSGVRTIAVKALGQFGGANAIKALTFALKDEDGRVRIESERALEKIGEPAIEKLNQALEDENSGVRKVPKRLIEKPSKSKFKYQKATEDVKLESKNILCNLPVIEDENISECRRKMINQSKSFPHPSMFLGSTIKVIEFVARLAQETEAYILSCEGVTKVRKSFLISNWPIQKEVLEIQYEQFWNDGTSSIYSEHVMRIGDDKFEVFGSEKSAARMEAVWTE